MHFSLWCIDYVDILGRSSTRGRQTWVGWRKQAIFEQNAYISEENCYGNRKLVMRFRLATNLMTLNWQKFEFSENFAGFCRFGSQ